MGRKLAPKVTPYARTDGQTSYRVRLRVNGRQTTETFTSEAAASVFALQVADPDIGPERAVALRNRADTASSTYVPTVKEMLAKHIAELTGIDPNTRLEYDRVAKRTWLPRLGAIRVDEITRGDIAKWINAADGTIKPKTIANAQSVLSATLNTAVIDGHLQGNPARGMRIPRAVEEEDEEIRFLTHREFDLLFAQIPTEYRPMIIWMFGMGTRWGETTAVQARDVNLDAGQFEDDVWAALPETKIIRAWKRGARLGPPKSDAGRRTIVIPTEVVDVISPILEARRPTDFLFQTVTGKPVRHSNFFNRIWKPATLRASVCPDHREPDCRCFVVKHHKCPVHTARDAQGHQVLPKPCGCRGTIPFRPNIHAARHTHASWLIDQKVRLDVIQHRLGHEDYLTTQRLYGHLLPDTKASAGAAASLAFARTAIANVPVLQALPAGSPST